MRPVVDCERAEAGKDIANLVSPVTWAAGRRVFAREALVEAKDVNAAAIRTNARAKASLSHARDYSTESRGPKKQSPT